MKSSCTAVLVAKRTSWHRFVEEAKDPHVLDLLRRNDPTVSRMRQAHEKHEATVHEVTAAIEALGILTRHVDDPNEPFDPVGADLLITVGGDGTMLAASHHVDDVPVLAINSAPGHSVGFFCGTEMGKVKETLERFLAGTLPSVRLTRMEVVKNDVLISKRVLNDALVCHSSPAATSRYILELGDEVEEQKSSGFWIGPAAGSTAAQRSAGGKVLPLDAEEIQLVIREPYNPEGRPLRVKRSILGPSQTLRVRSKMADARLFVDGPTIAINVTLGDVLDFKRSTDSLTLLGMTSKRKRG
jgi:NAD+ kinase